ncbi:phosphodiester glycosidase family protein [Aquihabitans sp. G128]|uniref:phosphodiester glycosidase family protein n=1 Tax=Aquihabitans sp. G128 TaxID=2849779 RepID=UPI001C242F1B|nr:phosphodiester glycosidase family protein [Aquihabitans sp. G128]QXC61606.1 phosphodiester glycosidase family protein [Aquihabitans sp. G128]
MTARHRTLRRATALAAAILLATGCACVGLTVHPFVAQGGQPVSSAGAFTGPTTPAHPVKQSAQPPSGWAQQRTTSVGAPLMATSLLQPDPTDPRAFVAAAWLSPDLQFHVVPGTTQPGGTWSTTGQVPSALRSSLVAVFNGGFKYQDLTGGFEAEARVARRLVVGQASLVVRRDGSAQVGAWGTDIAPSPDIVAVRQNLMPIVEQARSVPGLLTLHDGSWSTEHHQVQRTPRSALGQRPDGSLVYVAGPDLDLAQLAAGLVQAGAVTGMELDIHPNMVVFHLFAGGNATGPGTSKELLQVMTAASDRYLTPDRRDFVAVTEQRTIR